MRTLDGTATRWLRGQARVQWSLPVLPGQRHRWVTRIVLVSLGLLLVVRPPAGPAQPAPTPPEVTIAADVFGGDLRPLGTSLAEVGGAYRVEAAPSASLIAGGGALRVRAVAGAGPVAVELPQVRGLDVTARRSLRFPATGGPAEIVDTTRLRLQENGDGYRIELRTGVGRDVDWRAVRVVAGVEEVLASRSLGTEVPAGRWFRVETQVSGSSPVTLRARIHVVGDPVPAWQLVTTDTAPGTLGTAGAVGFSVGDVGHRALVLDVADLSVGARPGESTGGLPQFRSDSVAGFTHPGVVDGASSLSTARAAALAGFHPWVDALTALEGSRFAAPDWTPRPVAVVGCGARSVPDEGCSAETDDAQAAYAQALLWYFTGDRAHADKAVQILDAWSAVLVRHEFDTTTYVNGRLQAAWAGITFTRAAELLRYSDAGWRSEQVAQFESLLRNAFLPMVQDGWRGGGANGQLAMADATIAIGVFTDDREVYDDGTEDWRRQVRAAVYLSSDGVRPEVPAGTFLDGSGGGSRVGEYWQDVPRFVDGLEQETCRDAGHMAMGFAAAFQGAQTAELQGLDLYGEEQERLTRGMEYNATFLDDPSAAGWVCRRPLVLGGAFWRLTWEVGFRHYTAAGVSLPRTEELLRTTRPAGSALFVNWETLTHGTALPGTASSAGSRNVTF